MNSIIRREINRSIDCDELSCVRRTRPANVLQETGDSGQQAAIFQELGA
jgi:hypothetical protein